MNMRKWRESRDLGIEGVAARWYDKMARKSRMGEFAGYAEEFLNYAKDGDRILEVAPGPGYLSIEMAKRGDYDITGLDISEDMVSISTRNALDAGVRVKFLQGSVSSMPFEDGYFSLIVCTAAFKNFKEPDKALEQMYRVLGDGGVAILGDMNADASDNDISKVLQEYHQGPLSRLFTKYAFRFLRKGAYTRTQFESLIKASSFDSFDIQSDEIGFRILMRKTLPIKTVSGT